MEGFDTIRILTTGTSGIDQIVQTKLSTACLTREAIVADVSSDDIDEVVCIIIRNNYHRYVVMWNKHRNVNN